MKQFLSGIFLFLLFLYLLLFPADSLDVCTRVLILWSHSIVPSLLPVMILSRLFISTQFLFILLKPISFLCNKILKLSPSGTYALTIGYLCGYPMGVKTLSDLFAQNLISDKEAYYLAGFINNVSPFFIITYVCEELLHCPDFSVPFVIILYGASFTYGTLAVFFLQNTPYNMDSQATGTQIIFSPKKEISDKSFLTLLDLTIEESLLQILKIGGYILIFSLISAMICQVSFVSDFLTAVSCAMLEISYGSYMLSTLSCSKFWKYLLLIITLSFGGICSACQSAVYLKSIGLPVKKYLKRKAMTAVIALIYYLIYTYHIWITIII